MADQENNASPNFGGKPLAEILTSQQAEALQKFGFTDAEQVAAVIPIPGVMDHLIAAAGFSQQDVDAIVGKVHDAVPMAAGASDTADLALGAMPPTAEMAALGAGAEEPQMA